MCLNARAETVFELPSFRSPVLSKRCLIPATGYFEFHHRDKNAIPYYIFLKDEAIFSFGGLYEQWRNPVTNETERTFAILTVPQTGFAQRYTTEAEIRSGCRSLSAGRAVKMKAADLTVH